MRRLRLLERPRCVEDASEENCEDHGLPPGRRASRRRSVRRREPSRCEGSTLGRRPGYSLRAWDGALLSCTPVVRGCSPTRAPSLSALRALLDGAHRGVRRRAGLRRDEVPGRDRRTVPRQIANPLLHLLVRDRDAIVVAQVLGPGLLDPGLDEARRVRRVLEEPPLHRAVAATISP